MHVLARAHVKALKMGINGFLMSAPLGQLLVGTLQKAFAGKTGVGAKIDRILAGNLLIYPTLRCCCCWACMTQDLIAHRNT